MVFLKILIISIFIYHILVIFIGFYKDYNKYNMTVESILTNRFFIKENKTVNILIHCVSCGEFKCITPLIDMFIEKNIPYSVSIHTPTGFNMAKHKYNTFLKPYDSFLSMLHLFFVLKPQIIIISGSDTWPFFIFFSILLNTKIYYINYEIKNKFLRNSLHYYISTKIFLKQTKHPYLSKYKNKYFYLGDLKFLYKTNLNTIKNNKIILTIASAHKEEFKIHLNFIKKIINKNPNIKIIYIPRHLDWYSLLISKLKNIDFNISNNIHHVLNSKKNIQIFWKMGCLNTILQHSHICLMGGTFDDTGGHNLIEPGINKNPILTGPNTHTQENQVNILYVIKTQNCLDLVFKTDDLIKNKMYLKIGEENFKRIEREKKHIIENLQNLFFLSFTN